MRAGRAEMAVKRASEKAKSGQVFGRRRKHPKMFRVGLYARVSTQDQQTIPLQMRAMLARERLAFRDVHLPVQDVHALNTKRGGFVNDGLDRNALGSEMPVGVAGDG